MNTKVVTSDFSKTVRDILRTATIDEVYTEDYQLTELGDWISKLDLYIPTWNIRKVLEL